MDSTKDQPLTELESLLERLNEESDMDGLSGPDTITLSAGPYGYVPPGTMNFPNAHWSGSSITSPYTITTAVGTGTLSTAPWNTFKPNTTSAKISLNGEGADIEVNGWSLVDAVKRIEQRLGLFQPNSELEAEWEDLQNLAEQYKKLEQHIKDKQATFDRLKAMSAPDID
jgi:hypothetical protein